MNSPCYPQLSRRILPVLIVFASASTMLGVARTAEAVEDPLPPIQWLITEEPGGIRWKADTGGRIEPWVGDENTQTPVKLGSTSGVTIRSRNAIEFGWGGEAISYLWEVKSVAERPTAKRFQQLDADNKAPSLFTLLEGTFEPIPPSNPALPALPGFAFRLIQSDGSADGRTQIYLAPYGFENGVDIPAFDVLLAGTFADAQFISGVTTPIGIGQLVGGVPKTEPIQLTLHGTASLTVALDGADGVEVPIVAEQTNESVFKGETHFTDVVLSTTNPSATERQLIRDTYAITPTIPLGYGLADATCLGGTDTGSLAAGTLSVAVEPRQDVTCTLTIALTDSDADGVDDVNDSCPATLPGAAIDSTGCSIDQLVPCDAEWRNHGEYLYIFAKVSDGFVQSGIITRPERAAALSDAARSGCGFY